MKKEPADISTVERCRMPAQVPTQKVAESAIAHVERAAPSSSKLYGHLVWDTIWTIVGLIYLLVALHYRGFNGSFPTIVGVVWIGSALLDTLVAAKKLLARRTVSVSTTSAYGDNEGQTGAKATGKRTICLVVLVGAFIGLFTTLGYLLDTVMFMVGCAWLMSARSTKHILVILLVALAWVFLFTIIYHFEGGQQLPMGIL